MHVESSNLEGLLYIKNPRYQEFQPDIGALSYYSLPGVGEAKASYIVHTYHYYLVIILHGHDPNRSPQGFLYHQLASKFACRWPSPDSGLQSC